MLPANLVDYSSLAFAASGSAATLAVIALGWCAAVRHGGYLLTMALAFACLSFSFASFGWSRIEPQSWLLLSQVAGSTISFVLIHLAMSQYVGGRGLGSLGQAAIGSLVLSGVLLAGGFGGWAMLVSFVVIALLLADTAKLCWRHRHDVPYLMEALALMAFSYSALFVARSYALIENSQWHIAATPDNWAEDLAAIMAGPFIAAFGPMLVALHHVRDRIALISEALTDPMTGLGNRRALVAEFGSRGFDGNMAIAMFDLDHFKQTNDIFGHQIGDDVLIRFGSVVARAMTKDTQAYRLGGEEFALIVCGGGSARAKALAERVVVTFGTEVVRTPLGPMRSTVSAGIAGGGKEPATLDRVLATADAALYEAKRLGRNRVSVAGEPKEEPQERLRLVVGQRYA